MQISRFTSRKPSKFAFASDEKSICRPTTSFVRRCLRRFPALPPRMRREARYCLKPRKGDCLRLTVRSGGSPPFSLSRVPRSVSTRRAQRPRAVNRARVSRTAPACCELRPRAMFCVCALYHVPARCESRAVRRVVNCVCVLCRWSMRCDLRWAWKCERKFTSPYVRREQKISKGALP